MYAESMKCMHQAESCFADKGLGVLVDTKLNRSQ